MKARVIISGPPSSGKSTLITSLSDQYLTFTEAARKIIEQETKNDPNTINVPWKDNASFSRLVIKQQIEDFKASENKLAFFDRGLPDVFAYFKFHGQCKLAKQHGQLLDRYKYHETVFICPPIEDIYRQDASRKESFSEATQIHELIVQQYQSLGYKICETPLLKPQQRLSFVLNHLGL